MADLIDKNKPLSTGIAFDYDKDTQKINIQAGELFAGEEAYKTDIYMIAKTGNLNASGIAL